MKTWQFIALLIAIFLQPVICYCWRGYWSQHIAFNQVDREKIVKLESHLNEMDYDLQHIKDVVDETLEITAKSANGIY